MKKKLLINLIIIGTVLMFFRQTINIGIPLMVFGLLLSYDYFLSDDEDEE